MIQKYKKTLQLISWDWTTLLLFEAIYKMIWMTGLVFLQTGLEELMARADLYYITMDNAGRLFTSPNLILGLLFLLLLLAFFIYMEITGIIIYFDHSRRDEPIKVRGLLIQSMKKAIIVFKPFNLPLLFFVILMMPLAGIPFTSGPFQGFEIPGFILDFIVENRVLNIFFISAMLIVMIIVFRLVFSLHEVVLENKSFFRGCKESIHKTKHKFIGSIFSFILWNVLYIIFEIIAAAAVIAILLAVAKFFRTGVEAKDYFWFNLTVWSGLGIVLSTIGLAVFNLGYISVYYFEQSGCSIVNPQKDERHLLLRTGKKVVVLVMVFLILGLYIDNTPYAVSAAMLRDDNAHIDIVAHRAGAMFAPENTIAALHEAIDSKADYAEIDVQETKDGQLIVMHDANFERTAGVRKNVWDVEFNELRQYDAGIRTAYRYKDEKIPTLEEMIQEAGNNIKLMIELKSTGHEQNLEQRTVDLIRQYQYQEQCMVVSMDRKILKKIKELAPEIKTGLISAVAYGSLENMEEADAFSVEATFVTRNMISRLKANGKPIYVWTLNNEKSIRKYVEMGVDGIITDNQYLASYVLDTRGQDLLLDGIVDKILGQ